MTNRSHNTHKQSLFILMTICLTLYLAACGSDTPPTQSAIVVATPASPSVPITVPEQPTIAATSGCEEYFQFCNTIRISGTITAEATMGSMGQGATCATWAASDEPRILELPVVVAAGASKITVALTRVGAYTEPGTYELAASTSTGMPDTFPAINVDGRAFSNGADSAAVVTVAADGSGMIKATGLVELASVQVANPDPTARIDFAMTWTCQESAE